MKRGEKVMLQTMGAGTECEETMRLLLGNRGKCLEWARLIQFYRGVWVEFRSTYVVDKDNPGTSS